MSPVVLPAPARTPPAEVQTDQVDFDELVQWLRRRDPVRWALAAMIVVWSVVFIRLGWLRHARFGTFGFDLGISMVITLSEGQDIVTPSLGSSAEAFGAGFLVLEMWALLGYLLGTLARGPALSVGLGLVWALVIENLLRGVGSLLGWVESFTEVLPGTSAGSLIGSIVGVGSGDGTPGVLDTVPAGQAAITVAVYIVLAVAVSGFLVHRRDVA